MSVITKIMTLVRGSAREIGESVVDANATRIYEQEVVEAKASIASAKTELAGVMAKEMQTARAIEKLRSEAARYEGLAVEALDKAQESLAEEVAGKVGALEQELQEQSKAHANYVMQVSRLKDLIKTAEARVREHEREVGVVKTTESVYRATQTISQSLGQGGSKLVSARESLERIKQRHEDMADRMVAAEQLDGELGQQALEKKLTDAGVGEASRRQSDIMARIRAKQAAGSQPPEAGKTD
jgi:phage shock protein A